MPAALRRRTDAGRELQRVLHVERKRTRAPDLFQCGYADANSMATRASSSSNLFGYRRWIRLDGVLHRRCGADLLAATKTVAEAKTVEKMGSGFGSQACARKDVGHVGVSLQDHHAALAGLFRCPQAIPIQGIQIGGMGIRATIWCGRKRTVQPDASARTKLVGGDRGNG